MERDQSDEENEIVDNLVAKIIPTVDTLRKKMESESRGIREKMNLSAPIPPQPPLSIGKIPR